MSDYLETQPFHVNDSTSPEAVIETTQRVRLGITKSILKDGIPTDRRDVRLLNEILRDMDTNALTAKKLDVEEKAVNEASVVAKNVTDILAAVGRGKNPFSAGATVREVPKEENILPQIDTVPGQMDQGVEKLEYSDFVKS